MTHASDEARLAAHRARRGVKMSHAEKAAQRAAVGPARRPEQYTRYVECCKCGGPLPGEKPGTWRMWSAPRPRRSAGALDMSVCLTCAKELAAIP